MGSGCCKNEYDIRIQSLSFRLADRSQQLSACDKRNNQRDLTITNLNNAICKSTSNISEVREKQAKQQQEILTLQIKIKQQQTQLSQKQPISQELSKKFNKLTSQLQDERKKLKKEKDTLQQKTNKKKSLEQEIKAKQTALNNLKIQSTNFKDISAGEIESLAQKVKQLRAVVTEREKSHQDLCKEKTQLQTKLSHASKDDAQNISFN